jgi:two-component system, NarL family, response regulator LiaR
MADQRNEPDAPLRAIVAADDATARRRIREVLQRAGIVVIAEALTGREAVELCRHYRPDVALIAATLPELDGVGATREIGKSMPKQPIVMLTHGDDEDLGTFAMSVGALGVVSLDGELEQLPDALRGARRGEVVGSRGRYPAAHARRRV